MTHWPRWAGPRWRWRGWVYRPVPDRLNLKVGDHTISIGQDGGRYSLILDGYRLGLSYPKAAGARRVARVVVKELAKR